MKYIAPTLYLFLISSFLLLSPGVFADGNKLTRAEYIQRYQEDAVRDMKKTGVPASITLAQALLESSDGNSTLAQEANNHFGVKCSDWTGETYVQDDDRKDECFRKYKSVLDSYDDHSAFLRTRPRYASLFQLEITDYKGWAYGLKSAGYATNPKYPELLIKIIEDNQLYELDRGNNLPVFQQPVANNNSKPAHQNRHTFSSVPDAVFPYGKRHEVLTNNSVPYILAKANDDYKTIADEFEMNKWQILKYNELESSHPVKEGQKIYIKPKKRQGDQPFCIVNEGESLHDIAQEHGIKLRLLIKWNHLSEDSQLTAGQKILLKKS